MSKRIPVGRRAPHLHRQLVELHDSVVRAAADAGLDRLLLELVKIRASILNGCAFCLDMHAREARELGETERRVYMVSAWRETDLYTEQERAALALTDAMTNLPQTQEVPDDVYDRAASVFTEEQFTMVVWAVTVINAFNRLNVTSRTPLPKEKVSA